MDYAALLRLGALSPSQVPRDAWTRELVPHALKHRRCLADIPHDLLTPEQILECIRRDWSSLSLLRHDQITPQMVEHALSLDPRAAEFCPSQFVSDAQYDAAHAAGLGLTYIPRHRRTREMYLRAFTSFCPLNPLPDCADKEFFAEAVAREPRCLRFVPLKFVTPEIVECAVRIDGEQLRYVPLPMITRALCEIAIDQNKKNIAYVPLSLMTKEWVKDALTIARTDAHFLVLLCSLPEDTMRAALYGDLENESEVLVGGEGQGGSQPAIGAELLQPSADIVNEALRATPDAFEEVYAVDALFKLIDDETFLAVVKHNPRAWRLIPRDRITLEICEASLAKPEMTEVIKSSLVTRKMLETVELCERLVRAGLPLELVDMSALGNKISRDAFLQNVRRIPSNYRFLPRRLQTVELAEEIVALCARNLQYIPLSKRTYALCLSAVKGDGSALEFVTSEHMSRDLCEVAIRQNLTALRHVPAKLLDNDMMRIVVHLDPHFFVKHLGKKCGVDLLAEACRLNARAFALVSAEKREEVAARAWAHGA